MTPELVGALAFAVTALWVFGSGALTTRNRRLAEDIRRRGRRPYIRPERRRRLLARALAAAVNATARLGKRITPFLPRGVGRVLGDWLVAFPAWALPVPVVGGVGMALLTQASGTISTGDLVVGGVTAVGCTAALLYLRRRLIQEPAASTTDLLEQAAWWDAEGCPATAAVYRQLAVDAGQVRLPSVNDLIEVVSPPPVPVAEMTHAQSADRVRHLVRVMEPFRELDTISDTEYQLLLRMSREATEIADHMQRLLRRAPMPVGESFLETFRTPELMSRDGVRGRDGVRDDDPRNDLHRKSLDDRAGPCT